MNSAQSKIHSILLTYPDWPVVVAYSGGVDSQVLLSLVSSAFDTLTHENAKYRNRKIVICHVHHGLSSNADDWQRFAEQECTKRQLALKVVSVTLDINSTESLEAQAREARYLALHQVFDQPTLIFTGHHLDDQAETLLLALKRGSGVKGLSAMAELTEINGNIICRPLLGESRLAIEQFATVQQLTWVIDESNQDQRFDRNFLRNSVLPLINQRWPAFTKTVARSAQLCRENQQLADELAADDLTNILLIPAAGENIVGESNARFCLNELSKLSQIRFNNVMRYYFASQQYLMPSQAQLDELYSQLTAEQDKVPAVKLGHYWARRYQDKLYITDDFADLSSVEFQLDLSQLASAKLRLPLPDNLGVLEFTQATVEREKGEGNVFCVADLTLPVIVRFSHHNPNVTPDYRQHSRSLKKVLQELQLPPWQRTRLPFIYYCDELVAIPNYFVCRQFIENTHKAQKSVWVRWLASE
ncbi:tRNA lysidine(34) synthetase TilS [Colwellia sp. MEBiC06753]